MFDPLSERFNVAEHHRHAADAAELMPDSHHIEPVVGEHLAARHFFADAIDENFGAAAGDAAESGRFESFQHCADWKFVDFRKSMQLRRAEGMQIDLRKLR